MSIDDLAAHPPIDNAATTAGRPTAINTLSAAKFFIGQKCTHSQERLLLVEVSARSRIMRFGTMIAASGIATSTELVRIWLSARSAHDR